MKRNTFLGLALAGMLAFAPLASAGYWTGHSEGPVYDAIENWVIERLISAGYEPPNPAEDEQNRTRQRGERVKNDDLRTKGKKDVPRKR